MNDFLVDRPIENNEEDKLGRLNFSKRLAETIHQWKAIDSLVISLFGKWGSGKSSIINLAKSQLTKSHPKDITIIEFNPWLFSGEEKLVEHFFNELAKELELKTSLNRDTVLANKFRQYSNLLKLFPDKDQMSGIVRHFLLTIGILGISLSNLLLQFDINFGRLKVLGYVLGGASLIISLFSGIVEKIADYFEGKSDKSKRTVQSFKNEIKIALQARKNKLLVIIDDIDRLTPSEIRQIFKLIKINTDFPNIIFLLSFDRKIIEDALELQEGVNGQEYLEKIIQVNFDVPVVSQEKIAAVFLEECNKILETLPKSANVLFDDLYWGNIYNSGLRNLFKNVRDVKRFVNSLGFSFSLLHQGKSIEVNPIDFIAIEAIRIFAPDFYHFLKTQKELFTSSSTERSKRGKEQIEIAIRSLPKETGIEINDMISRIFPTIGQVLSTPENRMFGTSFGPDAIKHLRVCSSTHFDTYFSFTPRGDESEISQFEIDEVLYKFSDYILLVAAFKQHKMNGKLVKLLDRIQYYTNDPLSIPEETIPNFINASFEIADEIENRNHYGPWGVHGLWSVIISKLLYRSNKPDNNVAILKQSILNSKGLYGPTHYIGLISNRSRDVEDLERIIPKSQLEELQKLTLNKIEEHAKNGLLLSNVHFLEILFQWKEWDLSNNWQEYIETLIHSNDSLLKLLTSFISTTNYHSFSDAVSIEHKYFNFKNFKEICDVDKVNELVAKIPIEKYGDYSKIIKMFLKGENS